MRILHELIIIDIAIADRTEMLLVNTTFAGSRQLVNRSPQWLSYIVGANLLMPTPASLG